MTKDTKHIKTENTFSIMEYDCVIIYDENGRIIKQHTENKKITYKHKRRPA